MKKTVLLLLVLGLCTALVLCSCTLLRGYLDHKSGFCHHLLEMETHIREEDWEKAALNHVHSQAAWKKIKPLLQLDIDHDYVNEIENNLASLRGYIESQERPDSLATVLLIQKLWENIGQM